MKQCKTCGGIYAPLQADGTEYYHACPDLSDEEVAAGLGLPADPTTWSKAQRRQFDTAPKARPNKRDENVVPTTDPAAKRAIKAPGSGTVDVP
jgi:hypothetical protein